MDYPNKLIIIFPMHKVEGYRHVLDAIDDALVAHRRPTGEFLLELRPLRKLEPASYGRYLIDIAAEFEAGYTLVIVERDRFLEELVRLATANATPKTREAVECAAQVVAERTRYQTEDAYEANDDEHRIGRMLIASRKRRTKADRNERDSLNCRYGIPTPRSEQLWNVYCSDRLDVRSAQQARAAWERWTAQNRPDMPKGPKLSVVR